MIVRKFRILCLGNSTIENIKAADINFLTLDAAQCIIQGLRVAPRQIGNISNAKQAQVFNGCRAYRTQGV